MISLRRKDTSTLSRRPTVRSRTAPVTLETAKDKPGIWRKVKKWWHGSILSRTRETWMAKYWAGLSLSRN